MSIQNEKDLQGILKAGKFVAKVRELLKLLAKPGVSTLELDNVAKLEFEKAGAFSAPKFDYKFPGYTCISTNYEIAHGIPKNETILKNGDLVNIDVSAKLDGYYADTGISFVVGESNERLQKLCATAIEGTMRATEQAFTGNYLRHIGREIHSAAVENGFTVIKNLAGHGTGKKLHEEPQVWFMKKNETKGNWAMAWSLRLSLLFLREAKLLMKKKMVGHLWLVTVVENSVMWRSANIQ